MNRNLLSQLLLFLAAVILPSLAIVKLGSMVVANYAKELERQQGDIKRQREDVRREKEDLRRQQVAGIGQAMLNQLDLLGDAAASGGTPSGAVVLVGRVDNTGLQLPWDDSAVAPPAAPAKRQPEFLRWMEDAANARRAGNRNGAARNYEAALQSAGDDIQRGEAWLLLAQNLLASGETAKAREAYRNLLNLPASVISQRDVDPFTYFGAKGMMKTSAGSEEIFTRASRDMDASPATLLQSMGVWHPILDELRKSGDPAIARRASDNLERMSQRAKFLEQAAQLKTAFPGLGVGKPGFWQLWRRHGEGQEDWFVGTVTESKLVAIRTADVLKNVESGPGPEFHIGDEGEPLNPRLPGLRVALTGGGVAAETPAPSVAQVIPAASIYGLTASPELLLRVSLVFVMGLSLFAGYLLWRNTRREVRLAEMRSQFVSSVSHELRTPLTSIRMFAELLQRRDPADPASAKSRGEYLDMIVNESDRLTRLINNVLDFSQIEHGQKSYRMESTRLDEVVTAAAQTMEYPLAQQGFDLRVCVEEIVPPVEADRDALKQAILNLLTNAMKYSGKSRSIELRLAPKNGGAVIQVEDHGIGIPAGEQSRIFEKFYRARVPENRAIAGTGLGLALVAHIAAAHRGSVQVASAPGEGSTFSIHIPLRAGGPS